MVGFWHQTQQTEQMYQKVKDAAKIGVEPFLAALNESQATRQGCWLYILDKEDFKTWPRVCQKALFKEAWFDGFITITQHPQAIAITCAATTLSLFALSIVIGTSASLFSCVMLSGLICAASYVMGLINDDEVSSLDSPEL